MQCYEMQGKKRFSLFVVIRLCLFAMEHTHTHKQNPAEEKNVQEAETPKTEKERIETIDVCVCVYVLLAAHHLCILVFRRNDLRNIIVCLQSSTGVSKTVHSAIQDLHTVSVIVDCLENRPITYYFTRHCHGSFVHCYVCCARQSSSDNAFFFFVSFILLSLLAFDGLNHSCTWQL